VVAIALAVAGSAYLYGSAVWQGRTFQPRFHDEFMCLLQARMLSVGRLWMPPLPHGDFFDTFYVFVEPVYASLTWPGASLMYVPGMWLSLPYWVMPVLVGGAAVGLMYSVVTQLLDGVLGIVAALALVATQMFRLQALQSQAQVPIVMLALLFAWAWLRWRDNPTLRNAALLGLVAGWTAVTRPVDALCVAIPIGIAMFSRWRDLPGRTRWQTAGALVAGAAPFLALQLVFNVGVTGNFLKTPFAFYNQRDQPLLQFGFPKYDASIPLHTKLQQKQLLYERFVLPAAKAHVPAQIPGRMRDELEQSLRGNLPHPLLLAFVPVGVMQWFKWQRYAVWGVLPSFIVLYAFYTLFLDHYALLAAPAVIFMVMAGVRAVERNFRAVAPACTILAFAICIGVLPGITRRKPDAPMRMAVMDFAMIELPKRVEAPAVVLFKFHPGSDQHEEPVYNVETAWPDDAPIIRAHDLGEEKNREIIRYYAQRQPQRRFYVMDRFEISLKYLGTAAELWAKASVTGATHATTTTATTSPATR
jgi:hypothetical protein